ncbi:hypothetical protein COTS27_00982 [Spirochaetota bacterium]|nr:hypothetical protein COTS27_00982 [Spirochaetota bacterium]
MINNKYIQRAMFKQLRNSTAWGNKGTTPSAYLLILLLSFFMGACTVAQNDTTITNDGSLQSKDVIAYYLGTNASEEEIEITSDTITISAFTNSLGSTGNGYVTFSSQYTVSATTANNLTFTNPAGIAATNVNLGNVELLDVPNSRILRYNIIISFLLNQTQLRITSSNILNSPVTIYSEESISVLTECKPLDDLSVEVLNLPLLGNSHPLPDRYYKDLPKFYDRRTTDEGTTDRGYIKARPGAIKLIDNAGEEVDGFFTVNVNFPGCNISDLAGSGSIDDPFLIDNVPKLEVLSHIISSSNALYGDKHYEVINDLNLGDATLPWSEEGSTESFNLGFPVIRGDFSGTFDCKGYAIQNLYINTPNDDNVGLFATVNNAIIRNCRLENINITGRNYVGGLIGKATSSSDLREHSSIYVSGDILGTGSRVGGIAGANFNTSFSNVRAHITLTGQGSRVGGLIGETGNRAIIAHSFATGIVRSPANEVGGFIGHHADSTIKQSYANIYVLGNADVGGLTGIMRGGLVDETYTLGFVSGTATNIGGIAGHNSGTVMNSYTKSSVWGTSHVGGLVGRSVPAGKIVNSYVATPTIAGETLVRFDKNRDTDVVERARYYPEGIYTGGLVGHSLTPIDVTNAFWDSSTGTSEHFPTHSYWFSEVLIPSRGPNNEIGKRTTQELQVATTNAMTYTGWNDTAIWKFTANQYPLLRRVICPNHQLNNYVFIECTELNQ